MYELQNEVAEALCWLRMLMMAVTDLHWSELLLTSSFSDFGALSTELDSARMANTMEYFMIRNVWRNSHEGD